MIGLGRAFGQYFQNQIHAKCQAYCILLIKNTSNGRNRVRDTITVFDENGAIFVVSEDAIGTQIGDALVAFDWQNCLVNTRQYWYHLLQPDTHAKVFVFGHALLEQLISPYKSLCAHTLIVHVPKAFFELSQPEQLKRIDEILCNQLNDFWWRCDPKAFASIANFRCTTFLG